jgi:hypothetical protein
MGRSPREQRPNLSNAVLEINQGSACWRNETANECGRYRIRKKLGGLRTIESKFHRMSLRYRTGYLGVGDDASITITRVDEEFIAGKNLIEVVPDAPVVILDPPRDDVIADGFIGRTNSAPPLDLEVITGGDGI